MSLRQCKIAVVACVALLFMMIAANNLLNLAVNFAFVRHVLSMDTIPHDAGLSRGTLLRAIHSRILQDLVYGFIIIAECTIGFLSAGGSLQLARARHDPVDFARAKSWAVTGLTIGFIFLVTAFITIAGEWFYLWLAPHPWSGAMNSAARLILIDSAALVFLILPE